MLLKKLKKCKKRNIKNVKKEIKNTKTHNKIEVKTNFEILKNNKRNLNF
jgi:hypothetical protein